MKAILTGCSGLVGTALINGLFKKGFSIQCLKRVPTLDPTEVGWDTTPLEQEESPGTTLVHLAGENVAKGRWTKKKKESILNSRISGTRSLLAAVSRMPQKPAALICASAIGYYGDQGATLLDEDCGPGAGFLAEVCRLWEKEAQKFAEFGIRVVNLRFGMVLSPEGGALHEMLPAFRLGLGGVVGSGEQFISWVSIRDLVDIVDFVAKNESISGPVNVVSPDPVTNRELTKTLGRVINRPTFFTVPAPVVRLLFGEMADEMLLVSVKVKPKKLLQAGYSFRDLSLEEVLRYCTTSQR